MVRLGIGVGEQRLTAADLNRMLDERPPRLPANGEMRDAEEWKAEWQPA